MYLAVGSGPQSPPAGATARNAVQPFSGRGGEAEEANPDGGFLLPDAPNPPETGRDALTPESHPSGLPPQETAVGAVAMAQAHSALLALIAEISGAGTAAGLGEAAGLSGGEALAEDTGSEGAEGDTTLAAPGAIAGLVETVGGTPMPAGGLAEQVGPMQGAGGGAPAAPVSGSIATATGSGGGAQGSPGAAGPTQAGSGKVGEAALAALQKGGSAGEPWSPHDSAAPQAASAIAPDGTSGSQGVTAHHGSNGLPMEAASPATEQMWVALDGASSRADGPVEPAPSRAEDRTPETLVGSLAGAAGASTPQAGSGSASASPLAAGPTVSHVPLGAVAVEIGLKTLAGVNQFEIRLDPAELGRVEVRLAIENGEVKASLIVDRVETLSLLQREAKTLERAFEQAGLKPSEGGIDLTLRDPQGQGRGQGQHDERGFRREPASDQPGVRAGADEIPLPRTLWRSAGAVDLRI